MKKRLSKKILAIFLAALMVATSIPLSVLHVFAADAWTDAAQDAEVIKIENKMSEFESKLYEKGLRNIEVSAGNDFDVNLHEAITQIPAPSEDLKGKIVDVIETGYTLNDKVIRFAKVVTGN